MLNKLGQMSSTMTATHPQGENQILSALTLDERERLTRGAQLFTLELSQVLYRPGDQLGYVYFPADSIVSLLTELEDGGGMEVGLVGREGLVGISVVLGGDETKVATVQATGAAWRVPADRVREEFRRGGKFQETVLRYTHALMAQISQSVVCNARHVIPGRLARWLLMYHDRLGRDEFMLTHEFMSSMLGVRRSGVSEVAKRLEEENLISYHRGRIRILDRPRLQSYACECYPVVKHLADGFYL